MRIQELIANNFSRSATAYDDYAEIQVEAGKKLALHLAAERRSLVDGPILEIGCGTGYLSLLLVEEFPDRAIWLTDLSERMVEVCKERILRSTGLGESDTLRFSTVNGEEFEAPDTFALIVSSFTLQWFLELENSVGKLLPSLKQGGMFFFSVPAAKSFPEWRQLCHASGVPFTANHLPDADVFRRLAQRHGCELHLFEETFRVNYPSMLFFFRGLKALGASTSLSSMRLSVREMRRLLRQSNQTYGRSYPSTYHIIRGYFRREQ